jgi:hypothetical protein
VRNAPQLAAALLVIVDGWLDQLLRDHRLAAESLDVYGRL